MKGIVIPSNESIPKGVSNRNLLMNPFFTVNQRGRSSYTGNVYTVDRWKKGTDGTVNVVSNGLSLVYGTSSLYFFQRFEEDSLRGKTVTASIMFSDGTVVHGTADFNSGAGLYNDPTTVRVYAEEYNNVLGLSFAFYRSVTIRAVKLELGTQSTLAYDVAPDYAEELLKCQRYYYKKERFECVGHVTSNTSSAELAISLPTNMRTTPSIAVNEIANYSTSGWSNVTSVTCGLYGNGNMRANITASGILGSASGTYHFSLGILELSADL